MTAQIGNRYILHETIGVGGMGTVYRGTDTQTQQAIAIKQLRPEILTSETLSRFRMEAEALHQLNHPNIVKVFDAIEEDNHYYLVMELVTGGNLADLCKEPMPLERILLIALELSDALARAHHLNIIHRDIKPANILLATDGTPRLTDFGVARMMNNPQKLTDENLVGTLNYMSPETLQGQAQDTHSDIWSFGVVLFEMLIGKSLFDRPSISAIISTILADPLPDLEHIRPDSPIDLIDLVYRMLERDPLQRIRTVRMIGAELELILKGIPRTPSRPLTVPSFTNWGEDTALPNAIRHNIPTQTTSFVGREREINDVVTMLTTPDNRLITIIGYGGMGKSRLSLTVADQFIQPSDKTQLFGNGVFFIELAPIKSPDAILDATISALQIPFTNTAPRSQLLNYLKAKHALLIFDNFEHLLDGADLLAEILTTAPHVKILATSRERLNLSAEKVFVLEGMPLPDVHSIQDIESQEATRLFLQSAKRVSPQYVLNIHDMPLVREICELVYGMPLGIILAATWLENLTLAEIVTEMRQTLDILEAEIRDMPVRHRSMRATFEYSWDLLTSDEQAVFARFSVFKGGCTRHAAQAVTGASLRILNSLVNKSFLKRDADGRYTIHELMCQYATEKLKLDDPIHEKHADYYIHYLHEREAEWFDNRQMKMKADVDADFDNIRHGWSWCVQHRRIHGLSKVVRGLFSCRVMSDNPAFFDKLFQEVAPILDIHPILPDNREDAICLPLLYIIVGAISHSIDFLSEDSDDVQLIDAGVRMIRQLNTPRECAFALSLAGVNYGRIKSRREEGESLIKEAIALLRQSNQKADLAYAVSHLSDFEHYQESIQLAEELGDLYLQAYSQLKLGQKLYIEVDIESGLRYLRASLSLFHQIKSQRGILTCSNLLFDALLDNGELASATVVMNEQLKLALDIGFPFGTATTYWFAAFDRRANGLYEEAEELAQKAQDIGMTIMENQWHLANMWENLGEISFAQGRYDKALERYQKALALGEAENLGDTIARSKQLIADVYLVQNRPNDALRYYKESLAFFADFEDHMQNQFMILRSQIGLSGAERMLGNDAQAFDWLYQALTIIQKTKHNSLLMQALLELGRWHLAQGDKSLAHYFAQLVIDSPQTWAEIRDLARELLAELA